MHRLDIRGIIRPFSFLIISNAFKEICVGETIEILWGDPDSFNDLFKILPATSYDQVLIEPMEGEDSGVRIQLKKIIRHRGGKG